MPPEGTPTCHPSPTHMVPAEILWPEQPFAPRHRSQSQVRKQMRWLFSCQVLSAAQLPCPGEPPAPRTGSSVVALGQPAVPARGKAGKAPTFVAETA